MLEKVSHIAQQVATNVSRRQFLGRLGQSAATTAALLGGLLALPAVTHAGKRVRVCSLGSGGGCGGRAVGDRCGNSIPPGKCRPIDPRDKSTVVECRCHAGGGGGPF